MAQGTSSCVVSEHVSHRFLTRINFLGLTVCREQRGGDGMWRMQCDDRHLRGVVESLDLQVQRTAHVSNSEFYGVLKMCITQKDLVLGRRVHALAVKYGYESDVFLANHFICMYASHGRLNEARQVFTRVAAPNCHMWTSLISAHARCGQATKAVGFYRAMLKSSVTPNNHTFVAVLKACATAEDLSSGRDVHSDILRTGDQVNVFVGNCLVDMYAKCGSIQDARNVFDNLPSKNVVTWTAMIAGYTHHGFGQEALTLYTSMLQEGITPANHVTFVCLLQACAALGALQEGQELHTQIRGRGLESNLMIGTCLVDMYLKCGSLQEAHKVFDCLPIKDVVTWTAMIAGYARHGLGEEALTLYASMQQDGIMANHVTYLSLLQACGSVAGLEKGKEFHAQISNLGLEVTDLFVASTLIDMYCKCGSMVDAQHVFDALPRRNTVTWSALIAGYARQGQSGIVFGLFQTMIQQGIEPDAVTFLSILTACSHEGLVDKGQEYFEAMSTYYRISPTIEHYNCMIDLFGRVGHVHKAMEMVKTMPFEPHGQVWRSLLGACQKWSNVEVGRQAFECAVKLDENDAASYLMMWNLYVAAGMLEEAENIQARKMNAFAWKKPGQSWWTDIGGTVHTFVVDESKHPERHLIYAQLQCLCVKMAEEGYIPDLVTLAFDGG